MIRLAPLVLGVILLLAGCADSEPETLAAAQPIVDGDSCHVCGMLITEHPGPKGEAFMPRQSDAMKFCSTLDLFTFLKQPENETQVSHAYVHDMGITPWTTPGADAFINAEDAWYVIGHSQPGAMGHTLASFGQQHHAEAFRDTYGGDIIDYEGIDLELLGQLGRGEIGNVNHSTGHPVH